MYGMEGWQRDRRLAACEEQTPATLSKRAHGVCSSGCSNLNKHQQGCPSHRHHPAVNHTQTRPTSRAATLCAHSSS